MNILNKFRWKAGVLALLVSAQAYALEPGEGIVRDSVTGDYNITYRSGDPAETQLMQTTFVPSTKIEPAVNSIIRTNAQGVFIYRYSVSNGAMAKQPIVGVMIENIVNPILGETPFPAVTASDAAFDAYHLATKAAMFSPRGWWGDITRDLHQASWSTDIGTTFTGGGIQPRQTISGFSFASIDLPSIGEVRLVGTGAIFGYPDEGPAEDSAILAEIERLQKNDFVSRNAAVPTIVVPVPFDAALLLDRIRTHVTTWPSKQLLDPALATQLDRYLVSAADAYRRNQFKAGKEHIETLREMLKREHKDLDHDDEENAQRGERNDDHRAVNQRILIDRLAARILDFDLKYVLKRTEREDDDHKKH
jgi:hypothetical protein